MLTIAIADNSLYSYCARRTQHDRLSQQQLSFLLYVLVVVATCVVKMNDSDLATIQWSLVLCSLIVKTNCLLLFQSGDADAAELSSLFTMPQRSSSSSVSSTFGEVLVHQLRTTNCSKFTSLVNMHLSFLLDLSGTCLSELIENRTCANSATEQPEKPPTIVSVFSKKKHWKGSYN